MLTPEVALVADTDTLLGVEVAPVTGTVSAEVALPTFWARLVAVEPFAESVAFAFDFCFSPTCSVMAVGSFVGGDRFKVPHLFGEPGRSPHSASESTIKT